MIEEMQKAPAGEDAATLYGRISESADILETDLRRIVQAILNLQRVQSRFGYQTNQLLEAARLNIEAYSNKKESEAKVAQWVAAEKTIADVLAALDQKNPLIVAEKAEQLAYTHQNVLVQARIVTDLRPVFNDDADVVLQALATHQLVIDYWEGPNSRRIEFALDAADVAELGRLCERARKKASCIKHVLKEMPWPTSIHKDTAES
jgi:hypothetical protein